MKPIDDHIKAPPKSEARGECACTCTEASADPKDLRAKGSRSETYLGNDYKSGSGTC